MQTFSTAILAAAFSIASSTALAGAWTQDAGKGQVIVTGSYYSTDQLWNNAGNKVAQADYSNYVLNPYLEYGLADGITVGANLLLMRAQQDLVPNQTNWGLGDSEFFVRGRLWQQGGLIISAEPMVKLPSPESSRDLPVIGSRHPDAGLGLAAGYGFDAWGQQHFVDLNAGYRYRFGTPEDQVKLAGTLGLGITPQWLLMPQAFATYRMDSPAVAAFTQSSGDDYNLIKLQLSAVYKLDEDLSLQFGGFSHVDGKNVGGGDGLLFAVWKAF